MNLHPQYLNDQVVLPLNEFNMIMEQLEELEDIKLFDDAKKNDDGQRVLLSDFLKNREL